MGMYDHVYVDCPICKNRIEFQSKGGDCNLEVYTLETAPNDVIDDLNEWIITCTKCKSPIQVINGKVYQYTFDTLIKNDNWFAGYKLCNARKAANKKGEYNGVLKKIYDSDLKLSYDEIKKKYSELLKSYKYLVIAIDLFTSI